jgi:hypothetical protein
MCSVVPSNETRSSLTSASNVLMIQVVWDFMPRRLIFSAWRGVCVIDGGKVGQGG